MLTTERKQIVEKIISSNKGEFFRVSFLLSFDGSRYNAQILKVQSLGKIDPSIPKDIPIALPEVKRKAKFSYIEKKSGSEKIISPYQSLIFLNGSRPRAPSNKI